MRFFIKSLLAIVLAALIAGLLTYPAWLLASQFGEVRADRVMRRVGTLLLAIGLVLVLRRAGLANRLTLGYGLPRRVFLRQMAYGFIVGSLLMLPLVAALFGLHVRAWSEALTLASLAEFFLEGALVGFTVAFIEETFLRGAMFGVIQRDSGTALAIALPSLLYAAVHFLGGHLRVAAADMDYVDGLRIAADVFERFATPLEFADSFLALLALGVLLSLVRLRTGAIAGSVGLHAGGVCVITLLHKISTTNPDSSLSWLVGSYDGVIGWMAFVWIGTLTAAYWRQVSKTRK